MLEDAEAKPGGKKALLRVGTFGGKECWAWVQALAGHVSA